VLGLDGFGAAALEDLLFFVFVGGEEFDQARGIFLEVGDLVLMEDFKTGTGKPRMEIGDDSSIRSKEGRSKE